MSAVRAGVGVALLAPAHPAGPFDMDPCFPQEGNDAHDVVVRSRGARGVGRV